MAVGVRRGLFGRSAMPTGGAMERYGAMEPGLGMAEEKKKPGFFDRGGIGQYALAGISDFIDRRQGREPQMIPAMMAQMQHAEQQAAEQRARAMAQAEQRAHERDEWLFRQGYERENPTPDAFERTLARAGIDPASEQAQQLYRQRAESLAGGEDEFVVVPIPGRGTYAGPKSGLPAAMGQIQGPVGRLQPVTGGPTPQASGGFRR